MYKIVYVPTLGAHEVYESKKSFWSSKRWEFRRRFQTEERAAEWIGRDARSRRPTAKYFNDDGSPMTWAD